MPGLGPILNKEEITLDILNQVTGTTMADINNDVPATSNGEDPLKSLAAKLVNEANAGDSRPVCLLYTT